MNESVVFIANQDVGRRRDLAVRAEWPAARAELWDPMQGTVEKPDVEDGLVKLALEPSQAMFLVWRCHGPFSPTLPRVEMPEGTVVPASVGETITPMAVGEVKDGPVTRSPYVESVATTCAFTLPPRKPGERVYFVCDGTEGEDSAAVTVNGAFAGGFIGAPFRLDVTRAVREGANTLVARPFRIRNPRIVLAEVLRSNSSTNQLLN